MNAGVGSADMAITVAQPADPVLVGGKVTFKPVAKNNGANVANQVALTFNVDNGATVVSASALNYTCHILSLPITCDSGPALAVNASVIFTVVVQAPFSRFMTARAQISSTATDSNSLNNSSPARTSNIRLRPQVRKGVPAKLP